MPSLYVNVDSFDFGQACDDSYDFAQMLNAAGKAMSKNEKDRQEWFSEVSEELDEKGKDFVRQLAAALASPY